MKNKKKLFDKVIRLLLVLITIIVILIPVLGGTIIILNAPVYDTDKYIEDKNDGIRRREDGGFFVEVKSGETAKSVGLRLERAKIIKNKYFWSLIGKFEKEHIKSGTYKLDVPLSQIAIYRILVSGKYSTNKITIPEGTTIKRMSQRFEQLGICTKEEFMSVARDPRILKEYNIPGRTMEGYLFPDTYFFPLGYSAEQVVRTMLDNFYTRLTAIDPSVRDMDPSQLYDKIIIASIVEREYRVPEEAALMASVFYNRLEIEMGLQSCATVEYVITEILDQPHPGFLKLKDLEINNLYNTYRYAGLPPGPISSPGSVALRAALFPEKTDFYYFILEDVRSGRHIFSKTNEEHINARSLITKPQSR